MKLKKAKEQMLKVKERTIKQAALTGVNAMSNQVDGGEEVKQATVTAYMLTRPAVLAGKSGTRFLNTRRKKEEKQKEKQKNVSKEYGVKDRTADYRKVDEKRQSESGFSGKKNASSSKEDTQTTNKGKPRKFIKNIIHQAKLVLLMKKDNESHEKSAAEPEMRFLKRGVVPVLAILGCLLIAVALISIPIFAGISWLYHTPCAILCPPLEEGETVQDVAIVYVNSFYQEVEQIASAHEGYDDGKVVYADYEGASAGVDNFKDIVVTYMVKYGMKEAATVIDDTARERIRGVVNDMCSYTTSTMIEEVEAEDGTITEMEILCVNVSLKTIADMKLIYEFTEDQITFMDFIMSYNGFMQVEGGEHQSALSSSEINDILDAIPEGDAKTACEFALYRVGYPYSQDYRDSGHYYDCSSLVYYAWQEAGVNISYEGSNTASS